jgi:hypothetical protein
MQRIRHRVIGLDSEPEDSGQLSQEFINAALSIVSRTGLTLLVLATVGCASIGPTTVPRDRLDYVGAVAESWKEQTLLNIVRLRYGDAPSFLDVSSVISAYSFQGQFSAGGQISSDRTTTIPSNQVILGGSATYVDRPTITYTPLAGDRFAKSLLRPIPPSAIFELIQAGYPADAVLLMTTRAINGIYNHSGTGGQVREADPDFYPLIDALRRLQSSGAVNLRLEKRGSDEVGFLILSARRSEEVHEDLEFVSKVLGVRPQQGSELTLTFGALPRNDREIAILSRSMLEVLLEVAVGIDVPASHVTLGQTRASARNPDEANPHDRPLIRISAGTTQPANPYAAVRYRDTWYWIDSGDFDSKRVFTFLMMFFSLAETGVTPQAPVLTVPAN